MARVAFEQVTKRFRDGTEAVSAFTLDVDDGEFMVFVGPSGCGKTTALRMVAGLEDVTSGTIRIGEEAVNNLPPQRRDVAMVFQNYALYPHMTVRENMGFGLSVRSRSKSEIARKVRQAAELLDLDELLERKPGQLSGGQRQRVAMGRAIVREPRAFLMDEPLSNLDAKLRVQMRAEIAALQRELKVTTIYVTHDQTEAMTMGDRVAVLRKGELQQVDAPELLYEQPRNLFVAGFIGSPAMNFVAAEVVETGEEVYLAFGGHRLRLDAELVARCRALMAYKGRTVIVGIRPESFEDANLLSGVAHDQLLPVVCDLREALGSEVLAHFTIDAPPVITEDVKELAADIGTERLSSLTGRAQTATSIFVARLSPETRVRKGETIGLAVNTKRLHFFDPETNLAILGDDSTNTLAVSSAGGGSSG